MVRRIVSVSARVTRLPSLAFSKRRNQKIPRELVEAIAHLKNILTLNPTNTRAIEHARDLFGDHKSNLSRFSTKKLLAMLKEKDGRPFESKLLDLLLRIK